MNGIYQTIYETSYGIVKSVFKEELTFEEAVKNGKEYCLKNDFQYIKTEEINNPSKYKKT